MVRLLFRILSPAVFLILVPVLAAQQPAFAWKASVSHVWTGDADLDAGGEMGSRQTSLRLGYDQRLQNGQSWGVSLDAAHHNYDFAGPTALGAAAYWNKVADYAISASWRRPLGEDGFLFLSPSLTFAHADGADWGDSLRAGGIASYGRRFSDRLTVGFGAGLFSGLEETKMFPVLLVSWQINQQWRVGNPFRPGPTGPAGIELVYSPSRSWEVALGGGWRSHRFRLDEDGPNANGIAEVEGFPGFLRLTWRASERFTVDLYGGMLLSGEVTMENESGAEIFQDDLESAPIAALAIQADF